MPYLLSLFLLLSPAFANALDYQGGDIHKDDSQWFQTNLYHGVDQRGGPTKFTDTYLELEFGGRSGILDYYGYVDFLDILNASDSDRHEGPNSFAKVAFRFSLDAITKKDLALGAIKEWYIATEMTNSDNEGFGGGNTALRIFWLGLGTDAEIPWLGLTGINLQTRYVVENYGAENEEKFDGFVIHANWFKPIYFFGDNFIAFQGYLDYEFLSRLGDDNKLGQINSGRTADSFQSYLGFWYHSKRYALGYGAKVYRNMTQFKDGGDFNNIELDTTGVGHYFNVTYKF